MKKRIVILASEGDGYKIFYNALKEHGEIKAVLIETENIQKRLFKNRLKRLGLINVLGQVLFKLLVYPYLQWESKKRREELINQFEFNVSEVPESLIERTLSVNSYDLENLMISHSADLVILSGTRILSKRAIDLIGVPIWNIHAGITPEYRGVHGGYWSLVNEDRDRFGVTLHEVDKGIDTGGIIEQSILSYTHQDNFVTYPMLQMNAGLDMLKKKLGQSSPFEKVERTELGKSRLWSHPSIWQYIVNRWRKGVK